MSPLFALLWGDREEAARLAATLAPQDWADVTAQATEHRLRPLLHKRNVSGMWPAPPELASDWRAAYQRSGVRTVGQKAVLTQIGAAFAAANLRAVALKGGALTALPGYDAALRPMRDVDLLIEPAQAGRVVEVLHELRYKGGATEPEHSGKHLPPMVSGQSVVELHLHLFDTHDDESAGQERQFVARVWQRAEPASVPGLLATGATDSLLHLILHAVLDHQFNNGPLLLSDMYALVGSGRIDWSLFWHEAETLGAIRACQLALGLGEVLCGFAVDWGPHPRFSPGPALVERIARLMLVDAERRSLVGWPGQLMRISPRRWPHMALQMLRRRMARVGDSDAGKGPTGFGGAIGKALGTQGRSDIADAVQLSLWLRKS